MGDLLGQGAAWLSEQRHKHTAKAVIYARGALSVELLATPGRSESEQADEYGVLHRVTLWDWLIRVPDLVLGGVPVLPERGDVIREADGEQTRVYEVYAAGGEPPFRYCDSYRHTLRVHSKHVATE